MRPVDSGQQRETPLYGPEEHSSGRLASDWPFRARDTAYLARDRVLPYNGDIMDPLLSRITLEPDKRGGKPCIRGLRITVYDILEYLAAGMTEAQILADFPDLEGDDIKAVLRFAAERERRLSTTQA